MTAAVPGSDPRPLLLASRSPQRRAILEQIGVPFRVEAPGYEELPLGRPADETVLAHARGKAASLEPRAGDRGVLGVDTDVELDGRLLGKPADRNAAAAMLRSLAGREHRVISGLSLRDESGERTAIELTVVRFRTVDDDELEWYLEAGEWEGRAGAYAIQGRGARLVERIEGCYLNVVGLPAALLLKTLAGSLP